MTREEKINVLTDYCCGFDSMCNGCEIYKAGLRHSASFKAEPDEYIDRMLTVIGCYVKDNVIDMVSHPPHYDTGKFECIEVMEEALGADAVKHFCICNAFKYLYRNKRKNGIEDIKKAKWYIEKYIEVEESNICQMERD